MTRGGGHPLGHRPLPLDYAAPVARRGARADWRFPLTWSALLVAGVLLFVGGLAFILAGADRYTDSYLVVGGAAAVLALGACVAAQTRAGK